MKNTYSLYLNVWCILACLILEGGCNTVASIEDQEQTLNKARSFIQIEQFVEAESTLATIQFEAPFRAEALELQAKARIGLFDNLNGIALLREATALDASRTSTWIHLVQALMRDGSIQEAEKAIEESGFGNHPAMLIEVAQIKLLQGIFEEAIAAYQHAIDLDSTLLSAYYGLGNTLGRMGLQEAADSVLAVYEAKSAASDKVNLDEQIAELNPGSPEALYNLARSYEKVNDDRTAFNYYVKVVQLDSTFREAYNNMGILLYRNGQDQQAVRAFKKAISLSDTTAKYYFNLGAVYARNGDIEEARKLWLEATQLDPTYDKPRQYLQELSPN